MRLGIILRMRVAFSSKGLHIIRKLRAHFHWTGRYLDRKAFDFITRVRLLMEVLRHYDVLQNVSFSAPPLEALKSGNIIWTFWQIICHVGKCGTVRVGGHVAVEVRGAGAETRDRSDFTSESVLRQKEACREAVEKCRAGRGAHIQ